MHCRNWIGSILLTLAMALPSPAMSGQTVIPNYDTARDTFFWNQLYAAGGVTIYCGQPFTRKLGLDVEHVYPAGWMVDHLGCTSRSQCRQTSPAFNFMEADLHNLYPARCGANRSRSNMLYGLVAGERRDFGLGCDFEIDTTARIAEPPATSRGNIARSIFYLHQEYGLPIPGGMLSMLKRWNTSDPPDDEERARNDAIDAIQQTRNPFIDDPSLADGL